MKEIDTQAPQYASLLTGHYWEGRKYAARRTRGTRDYLLVLTLAGHGRFAESRGVGITSPGDLVLLAPGTTHDYKTEGPHWELLWVHFLPRPHWYEWLHWPSFLPGLTSPGLTSPGLTSPGLTSPGLTSPGLTSPGLMRLAPTDPSLRRNIEHSLRETHRLATGAGRNQDAFALNALEQTLLWCDGASPHTVPMDPRVQAAIKHFQEHPEKPGTLEDAAKEADLSPSRLAHLFKEQMGVTPGQFAEGQRMNRARQMLSRTSLSVGTIAADLGYDNPFYFTLRFKKASGKSPTEFRRSRQDKDESLKPA